MIREVAEIHKTQSSAFHHFGKVKKGGPALLSVSWQMVILKHILHMYLRNF